MDASARQLLRQLLSGNRRTQRRFWRRFGDEITAVSDALSKVTSRAHRLESAVPLSERSAWVQMFLFMCFDSLFTSSQLLVSGFLVPSGNLMRQFQEAVAMALLCSHRRLSTYDEFVASPDAFRVDRAMRRIGEPEVARQLAIDLVAWANFQEHLKFYHKYSHASALAAASRFMQEGPDGLAYGGEYDPGKEFAYEKELRSRASAAEMLLSVIDACERNLLDSTSSDG